MAQQGIAGTARMPATDTPMRTDRPAPRTTKRRRRVPRGWVPDQHGAWAMLIAPTLVGSVLHGATWAHLLLGVAWLSAYCTYWAAGRWLRSGRKPRYRAPVLGHGAVSVALGGMLLIWHPELLRWAPVYAVLLVVSLGCSIRRADRSWLNDVVTVLAACLMTVVAAGLGRSADGWWPAGINDSAAWSATGLLTAYFLGTVPYVKSMIRDRGVRATYRLSVGYHAVLLVAAIETVSRPHAPGLWWLLVATALVLLLRAALLPRRAKVRPAIIGTGEVIATLVVVTATLLVV